MKTKFVVGGTTCCNLSGILQIIKERIQLNYFSVENPRTTNPTRFIIRSNQQERMTNRLLLITGAVSFSALTFTLANTANSADKKKKVIVLGGGYAGRQFIKEINKSKFDVILVDKNLHKAKKSFLFDLINFDALIYHPQPNYVDSISENAVVDQYMYLPSSVKTLKDECVQVDKVNKKLTLKSDEVVDYDYLVFATGSVPDTNHIHMRYSCENSLWYFFKDKGDLETLMTALKIIGLEDIVIMGGGITGVELASEISKRILQNDNQTSSNINENNNISKTVTIIEPGDRLLPKLKESTSNIITKHLEDQKVQILTNAVIKSAENDYLNVTLPDRDVKLKAIVAVWTCGVKSDELAVKSIGHNSVNSTLALPYNLTETTDSTHTSVFAIGDCNHLLPKSAQNAKQQGAYLASYFNAGLRPTTPGYEFNSQGTMIRLSDRIYMDSPVYTGFLPLWVHRLIIGLDI